jgi:hypothetical protein
MRNIQLILEYDGSRYDGWQKAVTAAKNAASAKGGAIQEKVEEVLSKSHIDKENPNLIIYPIGWTQNFTPGEFQTTMVLHMQLANTNYFTSEGVSNSAAIDTLLREIEIGLWDNYLFFEYESFQNIKAQSSLASAVQNVLVSQQMMNNEVSQ